MNADRVFKNSLVHQSREEGSHPGQRVCAAIRQVMLGQCDDLGGGVYKKRLGKNLYRSIVVAKAGGFWVYEYLFAKKDLANIKDNELAGFRKLVKVYVSLAAPDIDQLLRHKDWIEICINGDREETRDDDKA